MKCESVSGDCGGHMVALTERVELETGLKADVPVLLCVGCGVRISFGPGSDLLRRWAKMYVRQAGG